MNDRLQTFLRACDRNRYFDLAAQALVLAITQMTQPNGTIPPIIAKACPRGVTTLQKARSGRDLTRVDLRSLAELEHALETPDAIQGPESSEWKILRELLASIAGNLPLSVQARLARTSAGSGGETLDFQQPRELPPVGWYAIATTFGLSMITGLSALPAAITFGGNAWVTAIVPLAVVALLVFILFRRA